MRTKITEQNISYFTEIIQHLSLAKDLNEIMKIVRKNVRRLTGADGTTFVLKDGDMCYYADEDAISKLFKGNKFPADTCISGWCMIHGEPAIIKDIYQDDRIPISVYEPTFVKSLVMIPIRRHNPIGAIGVYWANEYYPNDKEVEILQSLADITTVSIQNVQMYNELDKRVKERTSQLEAFTYSVAHDLKNPLAGFEMRLNTLENDYKHKVNGGFNDITNDLRFSVDKMNSIIQSLMDISKMGQEKLEKTEIKMHDIVQNLGERLKKNLKKQKNVNIHLYNLKNIIADKGLMERVWENLISNAIKYNENDEVIINIGMNEMEDKRIFYIKDNGSGFDQNKSNEIFKPFHRLDNENKYAGTGIGLAIVQQAIYKHGGETWAKGEKGKGATFYFSLPWNINEKLSQGTSS
ncbi:MAG: ATP-binding protein [Flavobacteriales bacterium]